MRWLRGLQRLRTFVGCWVKLRKRGLSQKTVDEVGKERDATNPRSKVRPKMGMFGLVAWAVTRLSENTSKGLTRWDDR